VIDQITSATYRPSSQAVVIDSPSVSYGTSELPLGLNDDVTTSVDTDGALLSPRDHYLGAVPNMELSLGSLQRSCPRSGSENYRASDHTSYVQVSASMDTDGA